MKFSKEELEFNNFDSLDQEIANGFNINDMKMQEYVADYISDDLDVFKGLHERGFDFNAKFHSEYNFLDDEDTVVWFQMVTIQMT